jgi:hypothetical protein
MVGRKAWRLWALALGLLGPVCLTSANGGNRIFTYEVPASPSVVFVLDGNLATASVFGFEVRTTIHVLRSWSLKDIRKEKLDDTRASSILVISAN